MDMKHTPEAMRDIARRIDEVAFNTGAIFPQAVNEAVAMLREIADEWEAQQNASAVKVPDEMLSEDPRNPYRHPAIHDGFTAGWNNCRAEVLRLSAAPSPEGGW